MSKRRTWSAPQGVLIDNHRNGYTTYQAADHLNRLEAELAESIARAEVAPDWRTDVENAPRDGTRILFGNATLQIWFGARWIEDRLPDGDDESGWKDDDGEDVPIAMTHWMPIPALPDKEGK